MGRTELNLGREREKYNGKDREEESQARPQGEGEAEADCYQARRRCSPQDGEARSSSGRSQGQGSPQGRLNCERRLWNARPDCRTAASGRTFFRGSRWQASASENKRAHTRRARLKRRNQPRYHYRKFQRLDGASALLQSIFFLNARKTLNFVDLSQHIALKIGLFGHRISVSCQQNTSICSSCCCSK